MDRMCSIRPGRLSPRYSTTHTQKRNIVSLVYPVEFPPVSSFVLNLGLIAVPVPEPTLGDMLEIVFSASYNSIHSVGARWDWCALVTFTYFSCLCTNH